MQGVTSAAFLLTNYARSLASAKGTVNCGGTIVTPSQLTTLAQKQVLNVLMHTYVPNQGFMVVLK